MTSPDLHLPLALIEGRHLANLVDQLTAVIGAADDAPDAAVARLVPDPYPDDPDAASEFAAATRDDILDRRTADAAVVRRALEPFTDAVPRATDEDHLDVVIRAQEIDSWLRTLTALRLVVATRLGITDDDAHDPDDARFGVYDWLAFRLEGLIAIADAMDEDPGSQGTGTIS